MNFKRIVSSVLALTVCAGMALQDTGVVRPITNVVRAFSSGTKNSWNENGLRYTLAEDGTAKVVGIYYYGIDESGEIIIPSAIEAEGKQYTVTSIGVDAFSDNYQIRSIVIPSSVTTIERSAFSDCEMLKEVVLPEELKSIGSYAFKYCFALEKINIPDSVESIGDSAFFYCMNLSDINIPKNLCSLGEDAFKNTEWMDEKLSSESEFILGGRLYACRNVKGRYVVPDEVTAIGSDAFSNCSELTEIVLSDNVTAIDEYAFYRCSALKTVDLPDSITKISSYAFYGCSQLTEITIPEKIKKISYSVFENCTGLQKMTIPDGVVSIESYAFEGCSSLKEIIIPESVNSIDYMAFSGCTGLTEIRLPRHLSDSPGYGVFRNCTNLKKLYMGCKTKFISANSGLPDDAEIIVEHDVQSYETSTEATCTEDRIKTGKCADCGAEQSYTEENSANGHRFEHYDYNNNEKCVIDGTKTSYCEDCGVSDTVYVPGTAYGHRFVNYISDNNISCAGATMTAKCENCDAVDTVPDNSVSQNHKFTAGETDDEFICEVCGGIYKINSDGTASIAGVASSSEELIISESIAVDGEQYKVTSISEYAFRNNLNLKKVIIPDTVVTIEAQAFEKCKNLQYVSVPESLKTIQLGAFNQCDSLREIHIPDGVSKIGNGAFANCINLESFIIPSSLSEIEHSVFLYCNSLTDILIPENIKTINSYAFYKCTSLKNVEISYGVEKILSSAFLECPAIESITIPGSVELIDAAAFIGCSNLKNFIIEDGVKEINAQFAAGTAVKSLNIPGSVKTLKAGGLYQIGSLKTVTLNDGTETIEPGFFNVSQSLQKTNIPGTVKEMKDIFAGCTGLKEVVISEGVERMDKGTFSSCFSLKKINIPDSVNYISEKTFKDCGSLEEVYVNCSCNYSEAELKSLMPDSENVKIIVVHDCPEYISNNDATCGADGTKTAVCKKCNETVTVTDKNSATGEHRFGEYVLNDDVTCISAGTKTAECLNGCGETRTVYAAAEKGRHNFTVNGYDGYNPDGYEEIICRHCYLQATVYDDGTAVINNSWFGYLDDADTTEYIIPDKLVFDGKEYTVTRIGYFSNAPFEKIIIPETVREISAYAFSECYNLSAVEIPESVEIIGGKAFNGTPWLDNMKKENPMVVVNGILIDASACKGEAVVPEEVRTIGNMAFYDAEINSVILNENLKEIAEGAFWNCHGLKKIIIPDSVEKIGEYVFSGCTELTSVTFPKEIKIIPERMFEGCSGLTDIIIPDSVTVIGDYAFSNCTGLKSAVLPANLKKISYEAFGDCYLLSEILIPEGVTEIGNGAFRYCEELKEIILPESLVRIGDYSFVGCGMINEVTIPRGIEEVGVDAFIYCDNLKNINIFCDSKISEEDIETSYYYINVGYKINTIHGNTNYISNNDAECLKDGTKSGICEKCGEMLTVTDEGSALEHRFGEYVSNNDATCLEYGTKTAVCVNCGLEDTVTDEVLADHVFEEYRYDTETYLYCNTCGNIEYVLYSDGTAKISCWMTYDSEFDIPEVITHDGTEYTVTSIGDGAFYGNESLTRVSIPDTVETIGLYAFFDCNNLSEIIIPETVNKIGGRAFYGTPWLDAKCAENPLVVVNGILVDGSAARGNVIIPDNITAISEFSFYENEYPIDIFVPDSVKEMDLLAVENAHGMLTGLSVNCLTRIFSEGYPDEYIESIINNSEAVTVRHQINEYISNNDALCVDGTKTGICEKCGKSSTITDEGTGTGHKYSDYVSDNNATCVYGTRTAVCEICGEEDSITDYDAVLNEHEYELIGNNDGVDYVKCSNCMTSVYGLNEDGTADLLIINPNEEIICIPSEIKFDGQIYNVSGVKDISNIKENLEHYSYYILKKIIADCNSDISEEEFRNMIPEKIQIEYTHKFGEYVSNADAACVEDGTKTRTCEVCGEEETTADNGSATGKHKYGEYVSNADATCMEDGTKTRTCEVCGEEETTADNGSAAGSHKYGEYVPDGNATCTENGTKTAKCELCGAENTVTDENTASGHSFTKYVLGKKKLCTDEGIRTAVCDNGCGAEDIEIIPGTLHEYYHHVCKKCDAVEKHYERAELGDDIKINTTYDLSNYDCHNLCGVSIKFKDNVSSDFNGAVVLGEYVVNGQLTASTAVDGNYYEYDFDTSALWKTPDSLKIYCYSGKPVEIEDVILHYENNDPFEIPEDADVITSDSNTFELSEYEWEHIDSLTLVLKNNVCNGGGYIMFDNWSQASFSISRKNGKEVTVDIKNPSSKFNIYFWDQESELEAIILNYKISGDDEQ